MRHEIRVAGFGGQGVITLGYVLANAAGIYDGKYSLMSQSYGPEARGGACRSDVIISDEPIDYPKISSLDYLIAMSIDAYNQFHSTLDSNAKMILEKNLVKVDNFPQDVEVYRVPAIKIAEELGNRLTANMVMLGAVQSITDVVSSESLKQAVKDRFPRYIEINLKAIERGMELGVATMGEG